MMSKHFRAYLEAIHNLPIEAQEKALAQKLNEWIGTKYEQVDDLLVIRTKF
jgi:hypothetical protein